MTLGYPRSDMISAVERSMVKIRVRVQQNGAGSNFELQECLLVCEAVCTKHHLLCYQTDYT